MNREALIKELLEPDEPDDDIIIEPITRASHSTREIYAKYGLAMFISQGVERSLALLLTAKYQGNRKRLTQKKLDDRLNGYSRCTFAALAREFVKLIPEEPELNALLKTAAEKRNWLAHQYFWDRAGHFVLAEGRSYMESELDDLIKFFSELDEQMSLLTLSYSRTLGVPDSFYREAQADITNRAIVDISGTQAKS